MIFAISDLHLSLACDKPMDVFGVDWHNYVCRIRENWQNIVGVEDTVVIPGDISWAMKLEDALADFSFIDKLNGKKIISKGNHDYFWETASKMKRFFDANEIKTIDILHNNSFDIDGVLICGSKGYNVDDGESAEHNRKILARECVRLKISLDDAKTKSDTSPTVFLHYPPVGETFEIDEITSLLKEYGVKKCYYGHIHGKAIENAFEGEKDGIMYRLISADRLQFKPVKIK